MIVSPEVLPPFTVARPAPGVAPEHLADEQVADWARAEHQVLLQATAHSAATGFLTRAWQIFVCQGWFLGGQGYWADLRAVGQAVLAAAEAAGDQAAQGWTRAMIGWAGAFTGAKGEDRAHQLQVRGWPGLPWVSSYDPLSWPYRASSVLALCWRRSGSRDGAGRYRVADDVHLAVASAAVGLGDGRVLRNQDGWPSPAVTVGETAGAGEVPVLRRAC
jgi:hypothetical protein